MTIEQAPFRKYNEEKSRDSFTINMNDEERATLEWAKKYFHQPKDSTAMKHLMDTATKYLLDEKPQVFIRNTIVENIRKNKRTGIEIID